MDTASVARLGIDDLAACLDLAADRRWPRARRKWSFLLTVGEGFGLRERNDQGEDLAGSVILSRFGPRLAWIGMMLVASRWNRRGLGGILMRHAMENAGADTIALHSTAEGLPLYEKLGFRMTGPVHTHRGRFTGHRDGSARTRPFTYADLDAVRALDAEVTGVDRGDLLTGYLRFAGHMRVLEADGVITGYAGSWRDGDIVVIGPVLAADLSDATDLIAAVASTVDGEVRLDTEHAALADWATGHGIAPWFETTCMVHGDDLPGDRSRLFTPVMQALG
jgi:GNAT superfamily N-acetyltransferase